MNINSQKREYIIRTMLICIVIGLCIFRGLDVLHTKE